VVVGVEVELEVGVGADDALFDAEECSGGWWLVVSGE
jgi:hypothetical protein